MRPKMKSIGIVGYCGRKKNDHLGSGHFSVVGLCALLEQLGQFGKLFLNLELNERNLILVVCKIA